MVTLNVTDAGGNWNTDTTNITVIDITKPEANAGSSRLVPIGKTVIFNGSSSSDNVMISDYSWEFNYGSLEPIMELLKSVL